MGDHLRDVATFAAVPVENTSSGGARHVGDATPADGEVAQRGPGRGERFRLEVHHGLADERLAGDLPLPQVPAGRGSAPSPKSDGGNGAKANVARPWVRVGWCGKRHAQLFGVRF